MSKLPRCIDVHMPMYSCTQLMCYTNTYINEYMYIYICMYVCVMCVCARQWLCVLNVTMTYNQAINEVVHQSTNQYTYVDGACGTRGASHFAASSSRTDRCPGEAWMLDAQLQRTATIQDSKVNCLGSLCMAL